MRLLPPLHEILEDNPPPASGLFKCRLVYNRDLYKIEYVKYRQLTITKIKIHQTETLYYPYKFANRQRLEQIKASLSKETEALLIIGDRITDTTYTNVALLKDKIWHTPAHPLLKGTRRCSLLKAGTIQPSDIRMKDLDHFSKIRLFNAMIPWESAIELNVKDIIR